MKLAQLAKKLKISTESFIRFIQDFDLELADCLTTNFDVQKEFEKFARENVAFLLKYEKDLNTVRSAKEIAREIKQPTSKVSALITEKKPKLYDNGSYKSTISTFEIDNKLGGDYQFVYDYFGKKTRLSHQNFIGYRDLFFYISRTLEPFITATTLSDWGIHKAAGIILYGPPGSGKIFWANKISEIINYPFEEVKKYYYGTSFVDGIKTSFNDYLNEMLKQQEVLLFMDDFDRITNQRNDQEEVSSCDEETKGIILHNISHFEEENLVMVGSANSLGNIDKEILAPGRFDVLIPIFPPNSKERVEMILHQITEDLTEESLLMKILVKNKANQIPFWTAISSKMNVFSNTMIIDFTQSLKKRIRNLYLKQNSDKIVINEKILNSALRDASAKLTETYLNQVAQFIDEVTFHNYDDFALRVDALKEELQHYKVEEVATKSIGFKHQEEDNQVKN